MIAFAMLLRAAGGTIASFAGLSAKMAAAARRMLAARHTLAALGCLDDRTLKDIGLHRSEIESLVAGLGVDRSRSPR
jgi:uncharacterized protein YjiS (DUF1127 family)